MSEKKKEIENLNCYLITAAMLYIKENSIDDYHDIEAINLFKETFLSKEELTDYEEIAPAITSEINKSRDYKMIYDDIYQTIVKPFVSKIDNSEYKKAYFIFNSSFHSLKNAYLLPYIQSSFTEAFKRARG